MKRILLALLILLPAWGTAWGTAWGGPVILGGDDLTDHGSRVLGANLEGWLYIQKAIDNLNTSATRPAASGIAALGSAANPTFDASNAGGAIGSAADVLGLGVSFFDGDVAINGFFADLLAGNVNPRIIWLAGTGASNDLDFNEGLALTANAAAGNVNPRIIWLAGTGAQNDLDDLEGAALTANAAAINSFVVSGGGLMAHGSGSTAYGWLSALLPGLTETGGCSSGGATLTPAGAAAFPGLSNSDIDANAGPCHSSFEGDFGGLVTLALDGANPKRPYIIGGGAQTVFQCGEPNQPPCPTGVPEPSSLMLLGAGAIGLGWTIRRARSSKRPGGDRAPSV